MREPERTGQLAWPEMLIKLWTSAISLLLCFALPVKTVRGGQMGFVSFQLRYHHTVCPVCTEPFWDISNNIYIKYKHTCKADISMSTSINTRILRHVSQKSNVCVSWKNESLKACWRDCVTWFCSLRSFQADNLIIIIVMYSLLIRLKCKDAN